MSFADISSYNDLLVLLTNYHRAAYPVLFLGAFLETLIPFSFVVYGEFFFLAGAVLAGTGHLELPLVATVLYAGGILGDNCSYWLGRRYGMGMFERVGSWKYTRRFLGSDRQKKGIRFFTKHGAWAVFLARLCGPFSWFVPALAGSFRLQYRRFLLFNTFGVLIGIGEFLAVGYLFGNQIDTIMAWLKKSGALPFVILAVCITLVAGYRLYARRLKTEGAE